MPDLVSDALLLAGESEARSFQARLSGWMQELDRDELYASAVSCCPGITDDGWTDLRLWLIAQGERAVRESLADPATLSALLPAGEESPGLEPLAYAADYAYERLTGRSARHLSPEVLQPSRQASYENRTIFHP